MGSHFHLAKCDDHCLVGEQQAQTRELRRRMNSNWRDAWSSPGSQSAGIIVLFNQLPAWVEVPQLSEPARLDY